MTRSHKAKRPGQSLLPHVDRRVPKVGCKPPTEHGKRHIADSMKLKQGGYGPLAELEKRLASIQPKQDL